MSLSHVDPVPCGHMASPRHNESTHLPLCKNGYLCEDGFFLRIFLNEKFYILIKFPLNLAFKTAIDKKQALVYIMAWHPIGDKPLSEPMLTRFTDAYMPHQGRRVNAIVI